MRQVAYEFFVGLRLTQGALFTLLAGLLLDLHEFDHNAFARLHLIDDDVHGDDVAQQRRRATQLRFETADGKVIAHHGGHGVTQPLSVNEPIKQRTAQHAAA